ncbi:MAG: 4Fe-4S dicluster domain-containing protein [Candidatus Omnitrophica bacterium]|nr:4Fe-4S dicluster domain-containing protein [Candidatus Omnitrophota bacterium]
MRYPKIRELIEAIKALVKGPYTSKFPKQPHQPFERFRGKPEFHEKDCVGCGACVNVCPSGALSMRDVDNRRLLEIRWDICIFCGQCQANCLTEKGIMLSHEFDLAITGNRESLKQEIGKDLVVCQDCGEAIAPYEQIIWIAKKLGPLTFSNPSLMLFYLKSQKLSSAVSEAKQEEEFLRADRIKILCPRCRREAVIKS